MWFLSPRCAFISSFAVITRIASADSSGAGTNGTWLYPDPSTIPAFNYLDTLNASWTSDFSTPWLHLYCGVINRNASSPVLGELYNRTAPATGSLEFPLNYALEPFSCHFELSRQPAVGLGPPYAMSGTFNVEIESNTKPVTWSQNTGTSSTGTTSTNANTNPESTATTGTNASTDLGSIASPTPSISTAGTIAGGSSGLSQGAKTGVGVGVALGVVALIAVTAAFYIFRRRKIARMTQTETYKAHPGGQNHAVPLQGAQDYATSKSGLSEMPAGHKVHEKDSEPVATNELGELEAPRY